MSKLQELAKLGQSIWYDYIRRAFITSGELQGLIDLGLRGVTSNPSIFEKAIAGSADYDEAIRELINQNKSVSEIYEALALQDVQQAADLFLPVYESTERLDGYVSLEVSPSLAHDTEGTIAEAKRLHAALNRPNIMIKVPATPAGYPAITELIASGINVNATLIFSLNHYLAVAEAYMAGLEQLSQKGGDLSGVASVASFFISRVDTAVDHELAAKGNESLQGRIGIANAKISYNTFQELLQSERWQKLARAGAQVQRLLWASTGTKNPSYPDTLYVDQLIGPYTVNTVPPATFNAFLDHGVVAPTIEEAVDQAREQLAQLAELQIDLGAITEKLQQDGVAAFAKSFDMLMASIAEKKEKILAGSQTYQAHLGSFQPVVEEALKELRDHQVVQRIWQHDHTVWKPDPTEIRNRLGWLHSPEVMAENVQEIYDFVESVRSQGWDQVVLLGMGGSSLAPEVFRRTFGVKSGYLDLSVLDSTDPGAVLARAQMVNPEKTLFLVSTKSGGTVETLSFFKFFYNYMLEKVGLQQVGMHFAAITDPGSNLVDVAKAYKFRKIFLNDPNIGGRYSALSFFGLVPAALVGVDLEQLLERAMRMVCNAEGCNCPVAGDNTGAWLGATLGELAAAGRDKLTLVLSPTIGSFGNWIEQLIAESTGKEGTGILPVTTETLGKPENYASDRLFVYLKLAGEDRDQEKLQRLIQAGHPVVQLNLTDIYDLGGEFFRWEMATAIAGRRLGINPFDQPNVEAAKVLARKMVAAYQEKGELPSLTPTLSEQGIKAFAEVSATSLAELWQKFLQNAKTGQSKEEPR
ncbi:MAG: bifunctional transaldolase/phosoglucose isomerase, partial [Calditrichaeota bacterium]